MNAENFAEIIKNPSQLYQFSYQELKSLVLQYPYCQNLQLLLLVKSFLDHHKDFDKILARTATLSIDRRHLHQLLKTMETLQEAEESFELGEEFLELKDLSSLEVDLAGIPLSPEQEPVIPATNGVGPAWEPLFPDPPESPPAPEPVASIPALNDTTPSGAPGAPAEPVETAPPSEEEPASPPLAASITDKIVLDLAATAKLLTHFRDAGAGSGESPGAAVAPEAPEPVVTDGLIRTLVAWSGLRPGLKKFQPEKAAAGKTAPAPTPAPKPKTAFHSWPGRFQPPTIRFSAGELTGHPERPPKPAGEKQATKKKKKEDYIIEFAERSLREHEEVATETLADLLVQQERYDKAIQMYKRLILIFPEKSTFFAEKIEELKKLS